MAYGAQSETGPKYGVGSTKSLTGPSKAAIRDWEPLAGHTEAQLELGSAEASIGPPRKAQQEDVYLVQLEDSIREIVQKSSALADNFGNQARVQVDQGPLAEHHSAEESSPLKADLHIGAQWISRLDRETMDAFSSPSSSSSGSGMSTEALMTQIKSQLAEAYAQEFLETVGNKCFAKCVTKPGTSLSGGESSCVSRCVDRYIEATGIISRALFSSPR
ncbi:Mitochondrial import inner membrane translocase subunit Tim13 [Carex littledalei]|uniref:Mitochondrial import inner membrane translocase subunit Tim13 n=1 Tax=Carex littledalei TaxID=544730 RepID=A0A833VXX0_9POAL|nr:Mitochondrial import inner membrane translocase subunit Tim13 [Carex littledalei]